MTTSTTAPMAGRTQGRRESRVRRGHSNVAAAATRTAKRGERSGLWHLIADECAEYGVRFR
jgi:hypothetical protein